MKIKILGTESFGVRGLCCVVEIRDRNIVIDPGLALGYRRFNLLPHPFQIVVGRKVRKDIIHALKNCTDLVISHYHGDHIPLVEANPYQLSAQEITSYLKKPRLWCKGLQDVSAAMAKRCKDLSEILDREISSAEGETDGVLSFSRSMPHGEREKKLSTVMMVRVKEKNEVFVHASDIQLLDDEPIKQILEWKPDVVLTSGPPLYLPQLSLRKRKKAWENALILGNEVRTFILDHHLLRCEEGYRFIKDLSESTGHSVYCAADYMGKRPLLLEAWRSRLYREMPVPKGWHKSYTRGQANFEPYKTWKEWNFS